MSLAIGPYVTGERPAPLTYVFLDSNGDPLDLTGYAATFRHSTGATSTSSAATITDAASGEVEYAWTATDMDDSGTHTAEFTVTNATNTYTSDRIRFYVRAAIPA
jgi:hypothetical protein